MSKHTPGPWEIAVDVWDWWIRSATTKQNICDALLSDNEHDYHLIAAAPEMYEALKRLLDLSGTVIATETPDESKALVEAWDMASAALAKATKD